LDDTNVLHRVGLDGLIFARKEVSKLLDADQEQCIAQAKQLHVLFSNKNISPGGVADMLGFLYCLRQIFS
jgi:triphosphoribosyl-dephospho-CoA synthase